MDLDFFATIGVSIGILALILIPLIIIDANRHSETEACEDHCYPYVGHLANSRCICARSPSCSIE